MRQRVERARQIQDPGVPRALLLAFAPRRLGDGFAKPLATRHALHRFDRARLRGRDALQRGEYGEAPPAPRARGDRLRARRHRGGARALERAACLSANEGSAATRDANTVVNASPPQEILAIYFRCLFFPARNASPRVASSVVAGDASVSGLGKSAAIRDIRPGASRVTTKACLERVVVTRVPIPSEHACVLPSRRRTANRSSFVSAWSVSATASASAAAAPGTRAPSRRASRRACRCTRPRRARRAGSARTVPAGSRVRRRRGRPRRKPRGRAEARR